ncbi:hypothetical protein BX600DRAFT_442043 [Xylariales sp. PMI_506]|nr:hypothetical protein BX600DRAFT_442043 [Xylariales sp. PMI_506]
MGCCFSRPAGPNAPYPGGGQAGSARAINSPRLLALTTEEGSRSPVVTQPSRTRPPNPSSPETTTTHIHRPPREQRPLSQHIDKPLRRHVWYCKDRAWTRAQLEKERTDFFETRVTGRPEVWQTLRAALEVLWEDDVAPGETSASSPAAGSDGESDTALATAQSIITAAEITLPTGDLAKGAYDSLGHYYPLPEWIVRDPVNIVVERSNDDETMGGEETNEELDDDDDDDDDDEILRKREEKGKAIDDARDRIKLRARLSETAQDIVVSVKSSDTIKNIKRKVLQDSGLLRTRDLKLVYMGKVLKDDASLESQGYHDGHVINAFVFSR